MWLPTHKVAHKRLCTFREKYNINSKQRDENAGFRNGNIYVLQKLIVGNQKAPLVQQSSFFLLVVIISAIMIIIIFLWYWLRRNNEKTDTN